MTYESTLLDLAAWDPRIVVMTAENRAAIRGLESRLGARFIDVGIAEQTLVGAAAGLAISGRKPVVHALAAFLTMRAFEFVRTDVGIPRLPVTLVGYVPGILSDGNGPTHQAIEDVALMRGIPGMQVFCPSDGAELERMLPAIVASEAPAYVRYTDAAPIAPTRAPFEIGRAEIVHKGSDVAILAYGHLVREALDAAVLLEKRGISARVVDLRTVAPVDADAVASCARSFPLVVTVEDHFAIGGLRSILAEICLERRIGARSLCLSFGADWFVPATLSEAIATARLDGASIAARVHEAFHQGAPS